MSGIDTGQRVLVTCSVCHIRFDASERSARDYRSGRTDPRCVLHRKRAPRVATVQAEMRRYWLDRFSMDEIVEIAHALFPRGTSRGLPAALTAAARGDELSFARRR